MTTAAERLAPNPRRPVAAELEAESLLSALEDEEEARQLARELANATVSRAFASTLPF